MKTITSEPTLCQVRRPLRAPPAPFPPGTARPTERGSVGRGMDPWARSLPPPRGGRLPVRGLHGAPRRVLRGNRAVRRLVDRLGDVEEVGDVLRRGIAATDREVVLGPAADASVVHDTVAAVRFLTRRAVAEGQRTAVEVPTQVVEDVLDRSRVVLRVAVRHIDDRLAGHRVV